MRSKIPFNKLCLVGTELAYIEQALKNSGLAGGGVFNKKCESFLTDFFKSKTLLCSSATHALEMSALLLNIGSDSEVILPSYTFSSCANAFLLRGARLRFVDNDFYGNLDLAACERALTKKTKAILAVHYAGNSVDMDKLVSLSKKTKVHLIEDAAQALGSLYKGKPLGTFGALGCISFHDTKNITCGEGGALLVNDVSLAERAEIIREKGTNRNQFLQGLIDKYTWVDIGSSYVLSEINAAFLYAQLERLQEIIAKRKTLWQRYESTLKEPLSKKGIRTLEVPPNNTPNYHLFALLLQNKQSRTSLMSFLKERLISAPFHYVALHTAPMGIPFVQQNQGALDNSNYFSECLLRLPLYYQMTDDEQSFVIESVLEWSMEN